MNKAQMILAATLPLIDFEEMELMDEILSPEKEKPEINMYEAFDLMHKQDGTSDGRPKCDFAL